MVRKINKTIKKKKTEKRKNIPIEEIDNNINLFLEYLKGFMEEKDVFKIQQLIIDVSSIKYMKYMIAAANVFTKLPVEKREAEEIKKDFKESLLKHLEEYEKEYVPRIITAFYYIMFSMNKSINRYFKVNYYRKRFKKGNSNKLYDLEEYKKFNSMVITNPIHQVKDRVFSGIWEEKIISLSKKLDKMLNKLNKFREVYIIEEKIVNEFKKVRNSRNIDFDECKANTKELKYLKKVFGADETGIEIINSYKLPIKERYRTEINLYDDMLINIALLESYRNQEIFKGEIVLLTKNNALATDLLVELKDLTKEFKIFFKNFEALVFEGDDKFYENIKIEEAYKNLLKVRR